MGLLGPRLALPSSATCVAHIPGDVLADRFWAFDQTLSPTARGLPNARSKERVDAVFAYLSHRDLQAWARGERSGPCTGFLELIAQRRPKASIVVSTRSAPKAQKGYPFLRFLSALEECEYSASWFIASADSAGLAHDVHYTVLVVEPAERSGAEISKVAAANGTFLDGRSRTIGTTSSLLDSKKPRLGTARKTMACLPGSGRASGGHIWAMGSRFHATDSGAERVPLCELVCPSLSQLKPQPVRLVSRHGSAGLAFKDSASSYALGPGTSACPLFAYSLAELQPNERQYLKRSANWHTERDGQLVVRARPERAVLLHGRSAGFWSEALALSNARAGSLYALLSRGMAPSMIARYAAQLFEGVQDAPDRYTQGDAAG